MRETLNIVKPTATWIVVADAKQAQIYTRQHATKSIPLAQGGKHPHYDERTTWELVPLPGTALQAEPADQYQVGAHSQGQVFESVGGRRSSIEPHMTAQDEVRAHFAKRIAEELNKDHHRGSFERLVLAAPAKMLGEIKKHLDKAVQGCIAVELPKELTHLKGGALAEHFKDVLKAS